MDKDVALVGCGAWGMNHLRVWNALGRLGAVCDEDPHRLEQIRQTFPGLRVEREAAALIGSSDISAVVIATPAVTHAELTKYFLLAGRDVLVEKPMALSSAEGVELTRIAEGTGRILMVGHVLEYHPAIQQLIQLVRAGELGRIRYLYFNRLNLGRIRTEENALWSFAPHDVAIAIRLLNAVPTRVTCTGADYLRTNVADVTMTNLEFPSDVHAHIFVSWLHPFKEHRFVIVGDRQMAVFDDTVDWSRKITLFPHRIDMEIDSAPLTERADGIHLPIEAAEPLQRECEHFLDCIQRREAPLTDGESGLRVLSVLEAAQSSLESGQQTPVGRKEGMQETFIHPTAEVHATAHVGSGTRIWRFSHVMEYARIGTNCILGQNVFVGSKVHIGDRTKVQNNVSVYEGVELEDEVFCGPSVVFTNVLRPRSAIEQKNNFKETLIKRGATLGANCTIVCGISVGRYAFIAAGAVVTKDVPDHALVRGAPAQIVSWVCECGTTVEDSEDGPACPVCGKRYEHQEPGGLRPIGTEQVPSADH